MNNMILNFLQEITDEERFVLSEKKLKTSIYCDNDFVKVQCNKVIKNNNLIDMRKHTRFIDFPKHSHEFVEVLYCLSGNIINYINDCEINMSQGDILFLNRNIFHGIKASGKNDLGINFFIKHNFMHEPLLMLKQNSYIKKFIENDLKSNKKDEYSFLFYKNNGSIQIKNTIENIILSFIMGKNYKQININKKLIGVLFLYLEQTPLTQKNNVINNETSLTKNIIQNCIENEYTTITLVELSNRLNMTIFQASKFIKDNFKCTFKQMLKNKRFELAKKLLIKTDMPIYDIMIEIGYENSSYFYKEFKKFFKKSPAQYRDLIKSQKNTYFQ